MTNVLLNNLTIVASSFYLFAVHVFELLIILLINA